MTSTQNIFDGFTALGCNIFRRLHGLQTLDGGTYHVHRVGRAVALGQNVLNACHFQYRTHRTTGDNTGTFRCRLHVHLGTAMLGANRVLQSVAVKRHIYHVLASSFHRLLDGYRNFPGLTTTETNASFTITHYSQCGEGKNPAAFNNLGDAVYLNQPFLELRRLLFVNAHLLHLLELQASFTGGVGQSLNTAMVTVAGPVKSDLFDTSSLGTLSNQLTDLLGCFHIPRSTLTQVFIQRRGRSKNLAAISGGDLGVHMPRCTVYTQAIGTQFTDFHAHLTCATQSFSIRAH